MRKLYTVGVAFAAVLAFSMVSASGASAFTLWDECSQAAPTLEFASADCNSVGTAWGWLEITTLTNIESLLAEIELLNGPIAVLCLGFVVGSVGLNGENEVTELLNEKLEPVTPEKLTECVVVTTSSLCTPFENAAKELVVLAHPDGLPWHTELVATGDLLGPRAGGENPGWFVECSGFGQTNLCSKEDTILKVENLEAELKVDLTFPTEEVSCTNGLLPKSEVMGTVSIFLAGAERALRAM